MNKLPAEFAKGFTLIELLISLALMVIVLTLGVPSFQDMIRSNRMATQSNRLLAALNLARSEAVKRGQQVTVCKANVDAAQPVCNSDKCDSSTGANCWENGWLVFADADGDGVVDDNHNGQPCEPGEDCIIRVFEGLTQGFTLRSGANVAKWVAYQSLGTGKGSNGIVSDTFTLCQGKDTANARTITLNAIGRARVTKGASACA